MENEDEEEKETQEQSTTRFLFGIMVFGSASFVFKLAWNLGLASLSSHIPSIGFIHAFTWLAMLYIVSRVISAGYMAEVERTINILAEDLQEAVSKLDQFTSFFSKKENQNVDSSDLN
jgi:hypothetical protein